MESWPQESESKKESLEKSTFRYILFKVNGVRGSGKETEEFVLDIKITNDPNIKNPEIDLGTLYNLYVEDCDKKEIEPEPIEKFTSRKI